MKVLVLFSGGLDSTTSLALAIDKYGKDNVVALSMQYGQKHDKELNQSNKICEYYGVKHLYLDLTKIFEYSDCSLLKQSDKEIPEGEPPSGAVPEKVRYNPTSKGAEKVPAERLPRR